MKYFKIKNELKSKETTLNNVINELKNNTLNKDEKLELKNAKTKLTEDIYNLREELKEVSNKTQKVMLELMIVGFAILTLVGIVGTINLRYMLFGGIDGGNMMNMVEFYNQSLSYKFLTFIGAIGLVGSSILSIFKNEF